MAIPTDVSSLAISVVSGALKLGKRLDEIKAEETALRSSVSLQFPTIKLAPTEAALRRALGKLLRDTKDTVPDPLGEDRAEYLHLRDLEDVDIYDDLFSMAKRYGLLESIASSTFKPDAAFRDLLRARSTAWDLNDTDILQYTFFVAAGPDLRTNSLGFRIGATLLDVLTEVAGQNARFVISHEPTRKLVETVLTKFSEPDLGQMTGWGEVLRQALRTTLNTIVDQRESLAGTREWLERALSAVAQARDLAPNGDDFVVGLFQGRGLNTLLRGVLSEGADLLSEGDAAVWEDIVSDVLLKAAEAAESSAGFEAFFQENWHSLVGAGFASLKVHGPGLLDEDDEILKVTLTAAVGALAESFADGPPNAETFTAVVETAIGVFADPGVLEESIREEWLREIISSVAKVVRDDGLRASFSQPALERYARDTLGVFARFPEVIADDNELVQEVLSGVLGTMAGVPNFGVGSLADAAMEGALTAISENPALLNKNYPTVIGQLAGGLAQRVANGGIKALQADAIVKDIASVVATNEQLFLIAKDGLAQAVVDAVLDAADEDTKEILVGTALVATVRRILGVFAARGRLLTGDLASVDARIKEVTAAGLAEASRVIGRRLAQEDVPTALVDLLERFAKGEPIPDSNTPEFKRLFGEIADKVTAQAA